MKAEIIRKPTFYDVLVQPHDETDWEYLFNYDTWVRLPLEKTVSGKHKDEVIRRTARYLGTLQGYKGIVANGMNIALVAQSTFKPAIAKTETRVLRRVA